MVFILIFLGDMIARAVSFLVAKQRMKIQLDLLWNVLVKEINMMQALILLK